MVAFYRKWCEARLHLCLIFFFFPTQNQLPEIITGKSEMIYHIKGLRDVFRTT